MVHDPKILSETEKDGVWSVSVFTTTRITLNGKSSREFACSAFGVDECREVAQFKAFHVSLVLGLLPVECAVPQYDLRLSTVWPCVL